LDPRNEMLYSRRINERDLPDEKYHNDWRDQVFEVIDKYEPDLLWFDFGLGLLRDKYRREFLAHYYNKASEWGREVAVTYKKTGAG
jgi:alpha-L-fucosidase